MEIKKLIQERAIKNKIFIRILKESRLYKRYFYMLNTHGNVYEVSKTRASIAYKRMSDYVFYGFPWVEDDKMACIWSNLFQFMENIGDVKDVPFTRIKNNQNWINFVKHLTSKNL